MHDKYAFQQAIAEAPVIHPAIFYDDCEGTFNYQVTGTGTNFVGNYHPTRAHSGTHGLYLATKSTTPAANDSVLMRKQIFPTPKPTNTLQLLFSHYQYLAPAHFRLGLVRGHAADLQSALLLFDSDLSTISYYNTEYGWTLIPGLTFNRLNLHWNHLMLSPDWQKNVYGTLTVNQHIVDLNAVTLPGIGWPSPGPLEFLIELTLDFAARSTLALDQILITSDIP